jgi:hypothetical protein
MVKMGGERAGIILPSVHVHGFNGDDERIISAAFLDRFWGSAIGIKSVSDNNSARNYIIW